jgi:4-hydroxy 2-oxovalerate aldolase
VKPPRVTDTTLRDGSHAVAHTFTVDQVTATVRALEAAGVPVVEVTHGAGLAGSTIQQGFSAVPEMELISAAVGVRGRARIAVLLVPGIGTSRDLREAAALGIDVVRIAVHCTEASVAEQHFGVARELGLEAVGFLMMSHSRPPEVLVEQALAMERWGAACVYVVDSAGAMLPRDAEARVAALKRALAVEVGFHAHNNLGVAIGNTIAALEAGADQVDGTLRGLGAGAGNAATEVLAAVLDRLGVNPGLDVLALLDAAENVVAPMMPFQPFPDRDNITLGYVGVYSSFLLHARHAAREFSVDMVELLTELGRRDAVAGQEDWILAVAAELAAARAAPALSAGEARGQE